MPQDFVRSHKYGSLHLGYHYRRTRQILSNGIGSGCLQKSMKIDKDQVVRLPPWLARLSERTTESILHAQDRIFVAQQQMYVRKKQCKLINGISYTATWISIISNFVTLRLEMPRSLSM